MLNKMKYIASIIFTSLLVTAMVLIPGCNQANVQENQFDIVIYGGTSSGVAAAIQSSRLGKTVILIEPTGRLGGLTTGGLGQTDIGNKQAIGGVSREFYENIGKYYNNPEHWKWHKQQEYLDGGQTRTDENEESIWTLAYHPRIPEKIRDEVSRWGTCKDEFEREDGWQQQLYIREARRMISDFVMTQKHCEGIEVVEDGVGLAAYGMDSHHIQRYITQDGTVKNEGNVEAKVKGPYPISYRSIVPKASECTNLLVPVCLSASHIAFGSIRMEPVFMVLGQSAASAASLAIDEGVAVQKVSYKKLKEQLIMDRQRL